MNSPSDELELAIQKCLSPGAFCVKGGRGLFMEVTDTLTDLVWMSTSKIQRVDFDNLVVEEPLVKTGVGHAPMDRAVFLSSPALPGGPVLERTIGGREWINVAVPVKITRPEVVEGPLRITVNKEHVIGFEAGRHVSILRLPHGDYVELVGENLVDREIVLPEGGAIVRIHLDQPWVVPLPTPTDAYFWFGKRIRSFQGPVSLPLGF